MEVVVNTDLFKTVSKECKYGIAQIAGKEEVDDFLFYFICIAYSYCLSDVHVVADNESVL